MRRQTGKNPQTNREHNRALILSLIRSLGPISRVELSRHSNLSKPVVTEIVDSLIGANLVVEGEKAEVSLGRRPVLLELNQEYFQVIGVDLARTHVEVVVTDLTGGLIARAKRGLDTEDLGINCKMITGTIESLIREVKDPKRKLIGVGIGYPFPLSTTNRLVVGKQAPAGWYSVDLETALSDALDVPVFMDNDANIAALHEKWYGVASSFQNFVYVMIGEGVGAGIFCDDKLYRGHGGYAGELGHILVNPQGSRCVCGKHGCLETEISLGSFLGSVRNGLEDEQSLAALLQDYSIHTAPVDSMVREYFDKIGVQVGNLINLLSPQAVILGGEVLAFGTNLLEHVKNRARDVVHPLIRGNCQIVLSETNEDVVAKGASALVQQHFFSNPHEYVSDFSRIP